MQAALTDPAVRTNPASSPVLRAVPGDGLGGAGTGTLPDSSFLQHLDPRLARPFLVGFSDPMQLMFMIAAGVVFIALAAVLLLKEVPLRTQSGIQARAAEPAAEAGTTLAPVPAGAIGLAQPGSVGGTGRNGHRPGLVPVSVATDRFLPGRRRAASVESVQPPDPTTTTPLPLVGAWGKDEEAPAAVDASGGQGHRPEPMIFGQVTQAGGVPVPGAALTLADLSGRQLDREGADDDGRYQLIPPSGGTFLVICASATHQPQAALVAVADVPVRHNVALAAAGASLGGTVRAAGSGNAVPDAVVTLTDIRGDVRAATSTRQDGGFELSNLAEGDYTLTVAALALQPVAHSIQVPAEGHLRHDVEVVARARLLGYVLTASAGLPVPEALVTLMDPEGVVIGSVISGKDGGFVFDDLQPGSYTLIATGYPPVAAEVALSAGEPTETVLTLHPPTLTSGTVADGATSSNVWE